MILASRSEYFRALLFGGMRETNQQEVELVDTPLPAFKHLLRWKMALVFAHLSFAQLNNLLIDDQTLKVVPSDTSTPEI